MDNFDGLGNNMYAKRGDLMSEQTIEKIKEAYEALAKVHIDFLPLFVNQILFTFGWWFKFGEAVLPWLLWIFIRNKKSTSRLLFAGFFVILVSSYLDFLGISYGLWRYPVMLTPTIPSFFPWDITLMPVFVMLLIQFKPHIHFIWKALFFGLVVSFVVEPFYEWIGHYDAVHWKHIYSLPIYIIIYIIADWLTKRKSFEPL